MPSFQATLSAADEIMPMVHTPMWLVFAVDDPDAAAAAFQKGIDVTVAQLPFLRGTVFQDPNDGYKAKISWSDGDPPVTMQEVVGDSLPSYEQIAASGWALHKLDFQFLPTALIDAHGKTSHPALVASYTKIKGGLLVCLAPQHKIVDGGGQQLLFNVIADNVRGDVPRYKFAPDEPLSRVDRFKQMLDAVPGCREVPTMDHPRLPVTSPAPITAASATEPPPAISTMLFSFSVRWLEFLRQALLPHTKTHFSLNSLMMAIFWMAASRARVARRTGADPDLKIEDKISDLVVAVNARKYWEETGLVEKDTVLGNWTSCIRPVPKFPMTLAAGGTFDVDLAGTKVAVPASIPTVIDGIAVGLAGLSKESMAADFAGYAEATKAPGFDFRQMGWPGPGSGLDLIVTNWGTLDLLPDYGPLLGRPACVRLPFAIPLDGVVIMMPRHRVPEVGAEALDRFDAYLALRSDDMDSLLQDPLLNAVLKYPPV